MRSSRIRAGRQTAAPSEVSKSARPRLHSICRTPGGKRLRLEDLRGTPVLLNFWAFWCDTWRAEMPDLTELAARQDELGFHIVAVSVDGTRLPEFAQSKAKQTAFPVLLDVGGSVSESYDVRNVPTVILLDAEGFVRYSCVAWPGSQPILNQLRKLSSVPQPIMPARSISRSKTIPSPKPSRRSQGRKTRAGARDWRAVPLLACIAAQ